jgi:hypothetical protein
MKMDTHRKYLHCNRELRKQNNFNDINYIFNNIIIIIINKR